LLLQWEVQVLINELKQASIIVVHGGGFGIKLYYFSFCRIFEKLSTTHVSAIVRNVSGYCIGKSQETSYLWQQAMS
jgi:hypothetical protein